MTSDSMYMHLINAYDACRDTLHEAASASRKHGHGSPESNAAWAAYATAYKAFTGLALIAGENARALDRIRAEVSQ